MQLDAIKRGEDREAFKQTMAGLGIDMPRSAVVTTVADAERVAGEIGYPVVIRPAYTMGGTGGGFVYNIEELRTIAHRGLQASLVHQILVEESVLGWEELELEVVRDAKNQMITVCFIENVDAMGVHTGDSYCTAPMLTISQAVQQRLQKYAYDIVEAIEVIGGTNVQFAHDPKTGRIVIIEINPRTSRSSALASKATGFPIAYVSALLAAGQRQDEALRLTSQLVELDPADPGNQIHHVLALLQNNRAGEAAAVLQQIVPDQLDDGDQSGFYFATLKLRLAQGRYQEAFQALAYVQVKDLLPAEIQQLELARARLAQMGVVRSTGHSIN